MASNKSSQGSDRTSAHAAQHRPALVEEPGAGGAGASGASSGSGGGGKSKAAGAASATDSSGGGRKPQAQGKGGTITAGAIRHFVLDTNVLLHDPGALFVFQEHEVIIPLVVIEELDTFKRDTGDRGRNARECIRHLDFLRQVGRLVDGVAWGGVTDITERLKPTTRMDKTGTVRIDPGSYDRPGVLAADKPDNKIIAVAWHMLQKGSKNVVFVSKDLNARIKADALGITTEDFENQKVDAGSLYNGFITLDVEGGLIDQLYRDRMLPIETLAEVMEAAGLGAAAQGNGQAAAGTETAGGLYANQFVVLRDADDESHTGLARRLADTEHLIPITGPRKPVFGIMARNVQQTMALDLLLDDEIRMITLLGSAGTGKTLMAVAAGMAKVFSEERYDKLLVARPIMPMGRDIGYLPGTKDDKLAAWMMPIFDNLAYLLSTRGATIGTGHGANSQHADSHSAEQRMQKLINDGKLVLEPLTYIRGRSIPHQFMIVDEAQNLTPHEIKTIVSRIGEGTKIILTGDIGQIDNPYLDASSNGLAYAIEKMKGLRIVGHVTLGKSERSELASLAAALL